ncbi:MAG: hypothetical protein K8T90_07355 [Planctomycetes bacterium]|nr:hypothetical protein [Planctomycetota bacterium]
MRSLRWPALGTFVTLAVLVFGPAAVVRAQDVAPDDGPKPTPSQASDERLFESVEVIEGDGTTPRPDDLLQIGGTSGIEILRGAGTSLRFRRVREQLFEIAADGKEMLVGLKLGSTRSAGDPPEINSLTLAPEILARLRGVVVEFDWDGKLDALYAKLDGPRCFVECNANEGGKLPPLPPGLRVLRLNAQHDEAPLDLAPLAAQTDLRSLEILMGRVVDFAPLAGAKGLLRLEAPVHPENASSMPRLAVLRAFRLASVSEVRDASFVARFPALHVLDVAGHVVPSLVQDLSAIGGLTELRELDASNTRVAKLPVEGLPALRLAELFGHRLSRADLDRFVAAHPAAKIRHDRRAWFAAGAEFADGIRVRFVPSAHAKAGEPRTLWTGRGKDELRGFLDRLAIDDPASGAFCMCDDEDAWEVDLLAGERVLGSLRFRSADVATRAGAPGDSVMTDDTLRRLGPWFATRGWPEYAAQAESVLRGRSARRTLDKLAASFLGEARVADLRDASSDVAIARTLRDLAPSAEERAAICIRLYYAVVSVTEVRTDVESRLRRYLRDLEDPVAVAAVVDRMFAAPAVAPYAAWFVVNLRNSRDRFPPAWYAKSRLAAARLLLAGENPRGRDLAMIVLRELGDPASAPDLMRVLPAAREDGEPATPPTHLQVDAATLLARWCDAALLSRLRAIAAAAPGDEADRVQALSRFDQAAAMMR